MTFIIAFLYFLVPFLVLKGSTKFKVINLLSPVVCCYGAGLILGNVPSGLPLKGIVTPITEITVLLSIPLLMYSTDLLKWTRLAGRTVLSFILVIVSVMIVSFTSAHAFADQLPEVKKLASMLVGVYTGGTANLAAIGMGLKVKQESFVLLNTADLILGAIYLLFSMTIGKDLLAKVLPPFKFSDNNAEDFEHKESNWRKLPFRTKVKAGALLISLAVVLILISLGGSHLVFGENSVPFIIMVLTAGALGLSFHKTIREMPGSFEIGEYFLLVFCMAIGSMANFSEIISASGVYVYFTAVIMFGSIILHFLLCILFRIDRDTALITSMAGIFGPAFIGPFAAVLKNREIVVSGVTTGLVGFAFGTYLGLSLYYILS